MEVAVLRRLQGKSNICRLFGCGKNAKFNYMVMTLQGKNLSEIRRTLPGAVFTLGTAFRLIKQCITALKSLHDAGFLHRDVKPSNFAIQRGEPRKGSLRVEVTLLDFGLARPYTVNGPGTEVRNARQVAGFRGTVRYASINAHAHQDLARRDDLWSLVYMFIEFVCGQLPWRRIRDKELVGQMKMALNHRELAIKSGLPVDIVTVWITHLEQLEYKSVPNYDMLITCLDEWLIQHKIQESDFYDWETPKTNSLTDDTKIQQPGTITLYKADHKAIFSEKFSQKEVRMQQINSQVNVEDIVGKQHSGREENKVKEDEDDEEQINKMNETLKPNTLLQVVRDNQILKTKSSMNLNNRHSASHCNLMTNSRSTAAEISKKVYDGKLMKRKNILKNHGSLGADLSSHDGDMENAIIIGGECSQNRHNKLSTVHNSADCILIDDEHEDDVKVFAEMDLGVDTNDKHSLRIYENEINNLNSTKNSFDNFQKNATTTEEKKGEILLTKSQLPITSNSSLVNVTNNIDSYKDVVDIKTEKPDLVSGKEAVQFIEDRCISGTNLSTKELNQNIQDDKLDAAGQSLFVPTFSGMSSSSVPQTSDCTTNPRAKIHAIIKNLLAGRQSKGNDSPKLSETTQRLPNWSGLVKTPKESNKFSDTNSSNLDLRVGSDFDKSTCRSNKASVFDQTSPYYIHFSLGHVNAHDNEQYHRFLTVPRKDHISLSTLRLNRTGESVTFNRSNPTFEANFIQESKHSITTSSDQILIDNMENTCITHNLNSQSENHYPVPRRKRTLYLNKYHSEQLIQPSQNISLKSLNIPQNNHENLIMLTKSSYQNNLPFEFTAENYRQKLIDNKQKHSLQKSMNSTKLVGQTIRPTLETSKNMHQNRRNTNNINTNGSTDNLRDSESLERIKQLGLLAKTLDVKLKVNNTDTASANASYEKSVNQQTFLRSSINGSKINQPSKGQSKCLARKCSEISYDPEISKSPVQYDNRPKRLIGKDSTMNTIGSQSVQQNCQQASLKSSNLHSTEKLIIRRNDDIREKQNIQSVNYSYSPLKIATSLLPSVSSTNLTDESFIQPNTICCKSIYCRQSIEKSHRRRLNSIHIIPSELHHSQQKNEQFTVSTFDNGNNNNNNGGSSCVSKINLRTLRSQSADRVIKPRTSCKNTVLQPCYPLQSALPNNSLSCSKSKRTLGITISDSQKACKINSLTPVRRL
uniref:Tau-tubulin kinase 1 n=1 Tax=Schistosoma haematobium TaxID=6185 RepID=A0A094ZVD9_SCHHA